MKQIENSSYKIPIKIQHVIGPAIPFHQYDLLWLTISDEYIFNLEYKSTPTFKIPSLPQNIKEDLHENILEKWNRSKVQDVTLCFSWANETHYYKLKCPQLDSKNIKTLLNGITEKDKIEAVEEGDGRKQTYQVSIN